MDQRYLKLDCLARLGVGYLTYIDTTYTRDDSDKIKSKVSIIKSWVIAYVVYVGLKC